MASPPVLLLLPARLLLLLRLLLLAFSGASADASAGISAGGSTFYKVQDDLLYAGKARFKGLTPPNEPSPSATASTISTEPGASHGHVAHSAQPIFKLPASGGKEGSASSFATPLSSSPGVPPVDLKTVSSNPKLAAGFDGLDAHDQFYSGTTPDFNGTQYSRDEASPSVCVGRGYAVHVVATAIVVYDTNGKALAGPLPLNEFFNLLPQLYISSGDVQNGDYLETPSCMYDQTTRRFFLLVSWQSGGGKNALDRFGQTRTQPGFDLTQGSGVILAASQAGNPTRPWNMFFIPGSNDGIHSHNDNSAPISYNAMSAPYTSFYPRMGSDRYGLFITFLYTEDSDGSYQGTSIMALPKSSLTFPKNSKVTRFVTHALDIISASTFLAPALVPAGVPSDDKNRGTTYFVGLVTEGSSSAAVLWALTNTRSMQFGPENLQLHAVQVPTPVVRDLPVQDKNSDSTGVRQKAGPLPILNAFGITEARIYPSYGADMPNSATFASGKVWFTTTSGYNNMQEAAVVYGRLSPTFVKGKLHASLDFFKLFGVKNQSLLLPSIQINRKGLGVVAFTLVGPDYYPSAAYARIDGKGEVGNAVYVAAQGKAALDEFDAWMDEYVYLGPWSSTTLDEQGNAWMCAQYVNGNKREPNNNWSTFIYKAAMK